MAGDSIVGEASLSVEGGSFSMAQAVAFRDEVEAFCRNAMPPGMRAKADRHEYFSREDRVCWQRILQKKGWFAGHWPRQYGGAGWGALQRFVFIEALERAGTPWLAHFGVSFIGPVIYTYGSEVQKKQYLQPILDSEVWWCQGFSEPGAGSDLASLATRAERKGDRYVVTGQKTWTTMAHWADMMFCLVRTQRSERRQQGITFLLIDMRSPGVSVRPIETIDGCHHVNEVYLDDVEVPLECRVGGEGAGWDIAKFIVQRERLLVAEVGKAWCLMQQLRERIAATETGGGQLARLRLSELEVRYETLRQTAYAAARDAEAGVESPIDASLLKIRGSELQQSILDLLLEVLAVDGLSAPSETVAESTWASTQPGREYVPGLVREHLYSRAASIYGGSNEIQRNLIARAVL